MAYEPKTKFTKVSVKDFVASVDNETRRKDAEALLKIFARVTGWKAKMWGPTIVGYGSYDYVYDSGHSGTACVVGFSPRKASLSIYGGIRPQDVPQIMGKLGKHKLGSGGCIYVNKLADIDTAVLEKLIATGVANMKKKWPVTAT
jgi:hypothetical protein